MLGRAINIKRQFIRNIFGERGVSMKLIILFSYTKALTNLVSKQNAQKYEFA